MICFPSDEEVQEILQARCNRTGPGSQVIRANFAPKAGTLLSIAILLHPGRTENRDYTIFLAETDHELTFLLEQ